MKKGKPVTEHLSELLNDNRFIANNAGYYYYGDTYEQTGWVINPYIIHTQHYGVLFDKETYKEVEYIEYVTIEYKDKEAAIEWYKGLLQGYEDAGSFFMVCDDCGCRDFEVISETANGDLIKCNNPMCTDLEVYRTDMYDWLNYQIEGLTDELNG